MAGLPGPMHASNAVLTAQHSGDRSARLRELTGTFTIMASRADGVYVPDMAFWAALARKDYGDATVTSSHPTLERARASWVCVPHRA